MSWYGMVCMYVLGIIPGTPSAEQYEPPPPPQQAAVLLRKVALLGPDVHAELGAAQDGQAGVEDAVVALALAVGGVDEVGPVDGVAGDGAEGDAAVPLVVALDEAAPALAALGGQLGEVGAAAGDVVAGVDVGEEGGDAVAAAGDAGVALFASGLFVEPVGVEVVLLADGVVDELDGLEVGDGLVEALEAGGAARDAAGDGVGADRGGRRGAVLGDDVALGRGDVGAGKGAVAGRGQSLLFSLIL